MTPSYNDVLRLQGTKKCAQDEERTVCDTVFGEFVHNMEIFVF